MQHAKMILKIQFSLTHTLFEHLAENIACWLNGRKMIIYAESLSKTSILVNPKVNLQFAAWCFAN